MGISYLKLLWNQFEKHDATGLAAQCAYYFLLSLFPFLLFIMSLLGYLPFSSDDVMGLIKEYIPGAVAGWMEETLSNLLDVKRGGTLSFGLILALVSASAAMNAIVIAVNKAYGLPERKSFIHSRFLAVMLTLGMLIVIVSALLLSVFGHWIGDWTACQHSDFNEACGFVEQPALDRELYHRFCRFHRHLLYSAQYMFNLQKRPSWSDIRGSWVAINILRLLLLCQQLHELQRHLWQCRGDHRADDVVLYFGAHHYHRR